jgi:hypothetical protein
MLKSLLAAALGAALVSSAALAQTPQRGGTPEEQKACSKDVSRYCRSLMNEGDFVVLGCLQQNRAKLSASCSKVLANHGQ